MDNATANLIFASLSLSPIAMQTKPPTATYPFPQIAVDASSVLDLPKLHAAVVHAGCGYRLGAKVAPLSKGVGHFREVDCSGYVRWLLAKIGVSLPDGSVVQHDAVRAAGVKRSDVGALGAKDGALRIVFLPPLNGHAGHVALWLNGESIESHGGKGPDRRTPAECGWLARATVYVLTKPVAV